MEIRSAQVGNFEGVIDGPQEPDHFIERHYLTHTNVLQSHLVQDVSTIQPLTLRLL